MLRKTIGPEARIGMEARIGGQKQIGQDALGKNSIFWEDH